MMRSLLLAPLLLLAAGLSAVAGPDVPVPETRLVVAGPAGGGAYDVGIAIALPEGWHTYWRTPGDSGVPPSFDTTGSTNLAAFEVAYPAPRRYFDGYGTSIVYEDAVLLPARVTAADPDDPVHLVLRFDYGYCREICVPAHAEFDVDLAADGSVNPAERAAVDAARAAVPVPAAAAGPDHPRIVKLAPGGGADERYVDVWVETANGTDGVDLFVEGPEGWYLSPPAVLTGEGNTAVFRLSMDGMPKSATLAGTPLRFTIVDGARAVDDSRTVE